MNRQNTIPPILAAIAALLLSSCATNSNPDERLIKALTPVRDQYAPDRRVAVFSVTPEWQNGVLVAKGEVDNPQAKADALAALKSAANVDPADSIVVLPDPRLGDSTFAIVTVSVGNVKSKPGHAEELANQLLMGMVVRVLKERGGWIYIQSNDDYLGWIQRETIFRTNPEGVDEWIRSPKLIATDYFALVRSEARSGSLPVSDVVAGALMRQGRTAGSWREVILPDGRRGFVERTKVEDYQKWRSSRKLSAQNVEETAKLFLGVPYLWGGTSAKGFDCSGFTKTVFRLNGVELERDANQQATMGEDVGVGSDFQGLKKGDLIFFGRKGTGDRPERIGHVGIYLGKREFIHCPNRVRINSLDPTSPLFDPWWLETFVRARRITSATQVPEVG
jgi:hypothetical protein